ncbi:hypothetical protein BFP97_03115 [Roseivirga sp. 4D4]|uniref:hypothetical protein n=1 Tax=Roseivirga sp. 4D4 TaxID=1889784 RepID=UPI000852FF2A|nr:hypothetical protein [Roseivirga sp. 4D4]OEK00556.1 hypothetical protein BFP97_03115 [Roseivirga sp. 4D4]
MNTTLWIILGSLLLVSYAFIFIDAYKSNRSRVGKQQVPMFHGLFIGPLYYFILTNHQLRERKQFMKGMRRFS